MWTAIRAGLLVALTPFAAQAADCATGAFESIPYTSCTVDPAEEDLRLFHIAPDGQIFGTFDRINDALARSETTLGFAMNGAMYHEDRSPVGLYVEAGAERSSIVTADGPGNFGLLPNGVFCLSGADASVTESRAFADNPRDCTFAAQSGPMLVIEGALHPRFLPASDSEFIRNGVGVREDGTIVFAISDEPLNFHRFARLFRDVFETPNALYIDGKVSRLYAPSLNRHDGGFPLGPIVGTVVPKG